MASLFTVSSRGSCWTTLDVQILVVKNWSKSKRKAKDSLFTSLLLLDPVVLFGEGQYNLHSTKEISVTESFMGLDRDIRKCQNIETYEGCKTRLYIKHLRQECGCLPLSLKLSEKVK